MVLDKPYMRVVVPFEKNKLSIEWLFGSECVILTFYN